MLCSGFHFEMSFKACSTSGMPENGHEVKVIDFVVSGEARRHAAFDGEERAFLRFFRLKAVVGSIDDFGEIDVFFGEPEIEIFKRERGIEKLGMLFGLLLLRDARTDRDDCYVVAKVRAQQLAMRKEGREDRANMRQAFGMIFATKSTTTGHADEIQILFCSSRIMERMLAETCCAPSAVSDTAKKPSFLSARTNCAGRTAGYCATKEGASEAMTARLQLMRALALGKSSHTCLALLGQVSVQSPQRMQSSGATCAQLSRTRIAFTGQPRMHLLQS